MGMGGQRHAPAALPPGKTRYPLRRRLGGPQGRSGLVRIISPPPGFDPRTVQPLASRYTDWAIAAHHHRNSIFWNFSCVFWSGSGGLGVTCWPLVPKFAGSNPAEAVVFLRAKKILRFKPSVPCRRFAECKRSLKGVEVVVSAKLPDKILDHSSTWRHLVA